MDEKHDLLSFEELYQFCDFMVRHGIQYIRITGGEPLMRQGVVHFVEQLQALKKAGTTTHFHDYECALLKTICTGLKAGGTGWPEY